jgi:Leucine-rich repeat (LRR) protein
MFIFIVFFIFIGLSKLANLKVLDLSNNMIVRHESISAVGDMAFLKYLNLEHNPIAYIENHREITCRYLHENAAVELVRNCIIIHLIFCALFMIISVKV